MTKTMAVVIAVSRRVGQVTFDVSERTCWKNVKGLVLAAMTLTPVAGGTGNPI
jgi:hypothetical protein